MSEQKASTAREPVRPDLVVGIGASAGGIAALRQFFSHTTDGNGLAYIVNLHLAPDVESKLAEVLQTATRLPVTQVRGESAIARDHVYVIPPNANLAMTDAHLRVSPINPAEQRHAPVDFLFRTLAEAYGAKAVAVVMSGTGPHGSSGIKRVKENGGLAIVQDPAEAEYGDMPRNALATGLVDYILPVATMSSVIRGYQDRVISQHAEQDAAVPADANMLRDLLTLLRVRTGHDFGNYKPATLFRRIDRRMHVHGLNELREYVQFLRERPEEVGLLLNELLISVTNFFRDVDAYRVLEQRIVPRLFENKRPIDQVRVWAAGCATGEEAYSIAMLLAEHALRAVPTPRIQLFGTDLDERAIAAARDGFYTLAETADVSEERLRRFFTHERTGYRVRRELRELVLFATHNIIKVPPFPHLDLIACRNLLIYLNRPAQERLLETFHFALRPGGFLFLGASEMTDAAADLFVTFDKSAHIFESRPVSSRITPELYEMPPAVTVPRFPLAAYEARPSERLTPADLHLQLLEFFAAPSILVTDEHQILHVSESATKFLEMAAGEPSRDLIRLIRPALSMDLRAALHQATNERNMVRVERVQVPPEQGGGSVTISVRPVLTGRDRARGYFLVMFESEQPSPDVTPPLRLVSPTAGPVTELENELSQMKAQLRATIEQYETQVEEAKAANEELQAMNEELRSAAEELETSKEELQSVNEELTTVNQELKLKLEQLALANNDLQNFINSTEIATIFLDRTLRVKLFTARARDIFNLLPNDVGRPLCDITSTLRYEGLRQDMEDVLGRLQSVERKVQTQSGRRYLVRILPYRTADDRIEGVVLTFLVIRRERTPRMSQPDVRSRGTLR